MTNCRVRSFYLNQETGILILGLQFLHQAKQGATPELVAWEEVKPLKRTASGYGMRIDPIYRTLRFHFALRRLADDTNLTSRVSPSNRSTRICYRLPCKLLKFCRLHQR